MAKATTKFFELIVGQKDGEVHSGDVPVRWCVSNGLIEHLEEQGRKNPHVLLVPVNPDRVWFDDSVSFGGEVGERKLVPMKDLMTYVRFNRPGKCRLLAFIVSDEDGNVKKLKKTFLKKYSGYYETDILDDEGVYDRDSFSPEAHLTIYEEHVDVNIDVPEGVFGKEPAPWRRWFANLWHRGSLEDECHFRQRFWLIGPFKFFPVAAIASWFFVVRGAVALGAFLLGYKNVNWAPIIHPFDMWSRDVCDKCDNDENFFLNLFAVKQDGSYDDVVETLSSGVGLFVSPFFLIFYASFVMLLYLLGISFWVAVGILFLCLITISVVLGLITGLFILLERTKGGRTLIVKMNAVFVWFENWLVARQVQANRLDDLPELICPKNQDNVITAQFSNIPWHRRSIKLWFEATKNMVCKPMAK